MSENFFIPDDSEDEEVTPKRKKATTKSTDSKKETKPKKKFGFSLPKFALNERTRFTLNMFLLLLGIFSFAACFSYVFSWNEDQDKLINTGFFAYLTDDSVTNVANSLGRYGAWISHLLMYRTFGVAAMVFPVLLIQYAVRSLWNFELFSLKKYTMICISYVLWTSVFLGFFSNETHFLGGFYGFYINKWLTITIGKPGAFLLIAALFYVTTTLLLDPDWMGLFKRFTNLELSDSKKNVSEQKTRFSNATNSFIADENEEDNLMDFRVKSSLTEDEIEPDFVSETVDFSKKKDAENDFSDLIEIYQPEEEVTPKSGIDDFEINIAEESPQVPIPPIHPVPSAVPINPLDVNEEDLATRLVREHGEFDPKKELEDYQLPPVDLLREYGSNVISIDKAELEANKDRIIKTLSDYKIDIEKIRATVGPTVTLYEIVPAAGVRISKIKNLEDDIALSLSALGIRIIAPMPGKGTIGIEVPNSKPEMVSMRSLIASEKFQNFDGELPIVMGKTITNETFVFDLTKMPHLLVAGSTGQGKSVGLNAILISLLYRKHPAQVKFVLVDPKKVEMTLYNKIERHYLAKLPGEEEAIITDTSKVVNTLNSLTIEMDARYLLLKDAGVRTIIEYNKKFAERRLNPEKGHRYLPYIVLVIDEFADLIMTAGKDVEHPIARLAQLARAIGIHLIVATQRPQVTVITGMIKANFPARIAFRVLSKIDSRTILDNSGADQLIGRGDMLILTGSDMKRLQCGFVDTPEVESICEFIGNQRAFPNALLLPEFSGEEAEEKEFDMNEIDAMFVDSARIVVINQQGSASLLQRKLKLGYNRAGRIVDQLEAMGIIGPFQGSKAREVMFNDIEALDEYMRAKGLL